MHPFVADLRAGARALVLGMLAAQAAALAATPLLTRLYSPAQFGEYALFLSLLATLAPIAALRFDAALPLAADDGDAMALFKTGIAATLVLALLVWLITASGLGPLWPGHAPRAEFATAARWLPLGLALTGAFQLGAAWQVHGGRAQRAALGRATQGIGTASAQVGLGASGTTAAGLFLGDVLGRALSALAVMPPTSHLRAATASPGLLRTASRYRGFATVASGAALLNAMNAALPVFVIGTTSGTVATGLYLLAQRVASLPATLLSSAVSQVIAVQLARTAPGAARVALFDATVRDVLRTALAPAIAIGILAPLVFGPVFGAEWRDAGSLATALAPFYLAQVLSASTISAVDVLELHGQRVLRELLFTVSALAVLSLGFSRDWPLTTVVAAFSAFGVLFYCFSLLWIRMRLARTVQ